MLKTKHIYFGYPIVIKLRPISDAQTFSVIPSTFTSSDLDGASVTLVENGTNIVDDSATFTWALSSNENYIEVSLTPSVTLAEGQIYSFELGTATNVYYRDIIYITEETNKKDVYTLPNTYTQYDDGDDEYIVL